MSGGGQQCTQGALMSTSFYQTKNVTCQRFVSSFIYSSFNVVIPADRLVVTIMELVW